MKIYVGHSREIKFLEELYKPIMESNLYKNKKYTFLFPHIANKESKQDRSFYDNIDLFFAEVTLPTTGLGIELGYAHDRDIPIVLLLKKGIKCSTSPKNIAQAILEYENSTQLVEKIEEYLESNY